jgi:hypothetical protein
MMVHYLQEKQILDLPTYNQYFYINNRVADVEEETEETETVTSTQTQQINQTSQATGTGY